MCLGSVIVHYIRYDVRLLQWREGGIDGTNAEVSELHRRKMKKQLQFATAQCNDNLI